MLLLSVPMSWICFRKAVLKPLCVGKARYSNKEKFGILEENLRPPPLVHQKADPHRFSQLRSPLRVKGLLKAFYKRGKDARQKGSAKWLLA